MVAHWCHCGQAKAHIIARRSTADGKHVLLWNDGMLTWALGYAIRGAARPRTAEQSAAALRAGWLVLGEVELYDSGDVSDLVTAARWVAARHGTPGDLRRRYAAMTAPRGPSPTWTVISTDRDGAPTVRAWRLPRLGGWDGLAVWHERGVYEIVREVQRGTGTYENTGFRATAVAGVQALLLTLRSVDA